MSCFPNAWISESTSEEMLTSERNPTVLGETVGVGAEFLEVRSKRKLRVEFSSGDRKEGEAAECHHLSE